MPFSNFHCVSPAWTPSRYNYLTGHYGGRCPADSFRSQIPDGESYSLHFNVNLDPEKETNFPHVLQDGGYFTGFTGKWHVGAILERLSQLGLEENTIVISSSDHGPVGGKFTFFKVVSGFRARCTGDDTGNRVLKYPMTGGEYFRLWGIAFRHETGKMARPLAPPTIFNGTPS